MRAPHDNHHGEDYYRQLFLAAGDALVVTDASGRATDCNPAACQLLGCSREELLGTTSLDWSPAVQPNGRSSAAWGAEMFAKVLAGEGQRFTWRSQRKNGEWVDVEVSLQLTKAQGPQQVIVVSHDITLRQRALAALREEQERFRSLFESSPDPVWIIENNAFTDCNEAAAQILGYPSRSKLLFVHPSKLSPEFQPDGESSFAKAERMMQLARDHGINRFEWIHTRANGEDFPAEVTLSRITLQGREVIYCVWRDISERKLSEEQLKQAASVFGSANEGIMITDPNGCIADVNDAFTAITGYARDEVLGRNPSILRSGLHDAEFYAEMWRVLREQGHWTGEIWDRRKDGQIIAKRQTISAIRDPQGRVQRYVSLFSDITALKEQQRQLEHVAHYDALTGLPNRSLLALRLKQAMALAAQREMVVAVVYLDLDGFKAINDQHGHSVGDQLLVALSARMKQCLREGDTLSRLGGDEFVAVLFDVPQIAACEPLLKRLLTVAAQTVVVDDLPLHVTASLGVSFFAPTDSVDADQLLRQADQAMYQAKLSGKNRYHLFDAAHDRKVRGRHEGIERIREALERQEFRLHYQPKVNMRSGEVIGLEALVRWEHPELGLRSPASFLPLIEDHDLIIDLGAWVIDAALAQMDAWQQMGLRVPVSVNVASRQFQSVSFLPNLEAALLRHPAVARQLELEILESSALEDIVQVTEVIAACQKLGVRFALDDFGTGYSSLSYLKRLPFETLKIDQSFVRDMLDDPDDLAILDGVLGLASAFRRLAIAEGVETEQHFSMLLRMGCVLGQGYAIARPMPPEQVPDWVGAWRPDPAWANVATLDRADIPVLFAISEHRAWVAALRRYLQGQQAEPPPLDCNHCRFGRWLNETARSRYAGNVVFADVERLHDRVHRTAHELIAANLDPSVALSQFGEIESLREALIAALERLLG